MGQHAYSPAEVAARVIAGLLDLSEFRAGLLEPLSAAVAQAVDELDPEHERDTRPTWWEDFPRYYHFDAVDRFRLAHDQLVVLEAQDGEVIRDLRALLEPKAEHRPGFTPAGAHDQLSRMAGRRVEHLHALERATRCLIRSSRVRSHATWISKDTARLVRTTVHQLERYEQLAAIDRERLGVILGTRALGAKAS